MSSDHDHSIPVRVYVSVLSALIVLTLVTVWVAYKDLGWLNDPVALGIAITKATLVVLFFMHVKYSSKMVQITALAGAFGLLVMFAFLLSDYLTRGALVNDVFYK